MNHSTFLNRFSAAGALITLGIVFGDIGTSPLYVMRAIFGEGTPISREMALGALSCVFWTLTLMTTIKYVVLVLRADNRGEGGILSLYALTRRKAKWLVIPAIMGASALIADGMITPPISVTSAVEGLEILYPEISHWIVPIVIAILVVLFTLQRLGTKMVGNFFGPMMLVWFTMLATLGTVQIVQNPEVFSAINPVYAIHFLREPGGFWLLGAVFLCTTGAEGLYADLGHCGKQNIRGTWTLVKLSLLLNYFGQGAWLIQHTGETLGERNPFFFIMPEWFIMPGVVIATISTVIASQAVITGSYTLISEAMRLNVWPKVKIIYPTIQRGQVFIPSVNALLFVGCVAMVLYFKESSRMEHAYGLAITLTMMMTTVMFSYYLYVKRLYLLRWIFLAVFLTLEFSFLIANIVKFADGGWVPIAIGVLFSLLMWVWFKSRKIKNRYIEFVKLDAHLPMMKELSEDPPCRNMPLTWYS